MGKKILSWAGILFLLSGVWYLLLRPYDYSASITSRTFPGAINQTLKLWIKANKNTICSQNKNLLHISNRLQFNDSIHEYQWEIIPLNDSTSKINVHISDKENSLMNRLGIPFSNTNFEKRTKKTILDFNNALTEHIDNFKVTVVDNPQTLSDTYCAYVPISTSQSGKTKGMMQYYSLLSSVLIDNNVELKGNPFLEITDWNQDTDSISYNFCFPIIKTDSLPQNEFIKYKKFKGIRALKAVYNGNYSTSDRAWYVLLDHAKKNNLQVYERPVEVFLSNPNFGGNELNWTAHIYMPLKE